MPVPLSHMDELGQIEFTDALSRLQDLIGTEIKVTVNLYGQFFGCGLQGQLNRVETLPPDHEAIALIMDGHTGVYLDPADNQGLRRTRDPRERLAGASDGLRHFRGGRTRGCRGRAARRDALSFTFAPVRSPPMSYSSR